MKVVKKNVEPEDAAGVDELKVATQDLDEEPAKKPRTGTMAKAEANLKGLEEKAEKEGSPQVAPVAEGAVSNEAEGGECGGAEVE